MKLKTLIVGLIASVMMISCASEGSTPETATETYVKALAMGECDKALEISIGTAVETVQGMKDAGCEKYNTTIVKTSCEVTGDNAVCICIEQEDVLTFKTFKYELERVDGAWKVASAGKDMPGMPNMEEMGMGDSMGEFEDSMNEVGEAVEGAVENIGEEVENGMESLIEGLKETVENIDTH